MGQIAALQFTDTESVFFSILLWDHVIKNTYKQLQITSYVKTIGSRKSHSIFPYSFSLFNRIFAVELHPTVLDCLMGKRYYCPIL